MIEGPEYITGKNLFEKVDPYDVYSYYLGYSPQPKKMYHSPFRRDSDPSFGVFMGKDMIIHKDFGDDRYKGNCVHLVMQMFNLEYSEAVRRIVNDMRLENKVRVHNEVFHTKDRSIIQITSRKFTKTDIEYWDSYGISTDDLVKEDVYSVRKLYVNKKMLYADDLCFAYRFRDGEEEFLKVYQPMSKKCKWLSSVPVKRALNLDKLEHRSDVVTLAKSKKDKLVLKKLITDVYECQKEGTEVISDYLNGYFDTHYDRKVCFFDNDEPGKRANTLLNPLGYEWINIPNRFSIEGIKDPSDYVKKYGYKGLEKMLREKELVKDFII